MIFNRINDEDALVADKLGIRVYAWAVTKDDPNPQLWKPHLGPWPAHGDYPVTILVAANRNPNARDGFLLYVEE